MVSGLRELSIQCVTCLNIGRFLAPLIEEIIFSPLYILASFVKDKVPIGVWVYLRALSLVLLVDFSVFVPVPYCLDCSFVVQSEVRKVDSSSSVLSQACFGYLGSLCFLMNCEIFCSNSVKNAIGNLIGIAFNLQIPFGSIIIFIILILPINIGRMWIHGYLSICLYHLWFLSSMSYSYLHTALLSLQAGLFLGILFFFVAVVNGIDSLISLSDLSLLVQGISVY